MLKLSIAITTYNHEKYIADALDSIYNQNVNFDYEIVIGNDNSTDKTTKIIQKYQQTKSNIKHIEYSENVGYVVNFDKTIKACKGEYIAIFDGDDIMLLQKLQKQINFLDNNLDYVMSTHNARAFDSTTNRTIRFITPPYKKTYYTIEDLIKYGSIFANSTKVFRQSALPKEGIDYNIKKIADWYITVLIAGKGKIHYIEDCLLDYRVHPGSIMKKIDGNIHFEDVMYILKSFSTIFSKKYDYLFNRQFSYAYLIKGIHLVNINDKKEARKNFIKSIKHCPFYSISAYVRILLSFILSSNKTNTLLN